MQHASMPVQPYPINPRSAGQLEHIAVFSLVLHMECLGAYQNLVSGNISDGSALRVGSGAATARKIHKTNLFLPPKGRKLRIVTDKNE